MSRREGLAGMTLGTFGASVLANLEAAPPAHAEEWVLFKGAQMELSPISCTRPKDPTKAFPRGSTITKPKEFEFVDPCYLGGYTLNTPWSFWGPTALQPLTGFRVGVNPLDTSGPEAPDPSGTLDARIESEYGVILVQGLPVRESDPWVGKEDISQAGSLPEVLDALNPQLSRNLVSSSQETDGNATTYYLYVLNNAQTKYQNRRIIKMAVVDGSLIAIDARCNENQYARSEPVLKAVVDSWRLGKTPSAQPAAL